MHDVVACSGGYSFRLAVSTGGKNEEHVCLSRCLAPLTHSKYHKKKRWTPPSTDFMAKLPPRLLQLSVAANQLIVVQHPSSSNAHWPPLSTTYHRVSAHECHAIYRDEWMLFHVAIQKQTNPWALTICGGVQPYTAREKSSFAHSTCCCYYHYHVYIIIVVRVPKSKNGWHELLILRGAMVNRTKYF